MPVKIRIDGDLPPGKERALALAFSEWEQASSGMIRFEPIWDAPRPGRLYEALGRDDGDIFFWYINKSHGNLTTDQIMYHWESAGVTWNYGDTTHIALFKDTDTFYATALHEIGHLLGLKHIMNKAALMAGSVKSSCITKWDVAQLCFIYGCEPQSRC